MKRYGSIYKITNTLSGKSYIGQTTQPVKKRFRRHISDSRSGRHLFFSIQKYGFNNFSFEEILTCFDGKSLNVAETYFIKYFNTFGEHGYNLTMGGEEKGQITEEVRKKMSVAKAGKSYTRKTPWNNLSRLNKSRAQGGKAIVAKCLLTGVEKIYDFINQAEKDGFRKSEIYRVLSKKRKHHKNRTFFYANQTGSSLSNIIEHGQRVGLETANAE